MSFRSFRITPEEKDLLRSRFSQTSEIVPMASDLKFFSLIAALGLHQEIGTIHDELSTFLFDAKTGEKVARPALRSEMIEYRGAIGVRIWADGVSELDPRVRGIRTLLHPEFSYDGSGRISQLVFFPETIVQIARLEGGDLVSVMPWGMNTVFGGFDAKKSYYEGNMFEFINLDSIRYSRLLEKRQIAFFGTHDLVSHIAGVKRSAWPELQSRGRAARILFETYFAKSARPAPFALVLPYALGMLLDDLAQPMNYESMSRRHVVELLMEAIGSERIDPRADVYLLKVSAIDRKVDRSREVRRRFQGA